MTMKINNQETEAKKFAYDGCHKIYLIEDEADEKTAMEYEYKFFPIEELQKTYENSCSLRFISNWKLSKQYVKQFEQAVFEVK